MDNGLAIYHTTIDDVALRKSPTLKEVVSFRNARKILSDGDVRVSKRTNPVRIVKEMLIDELDLSYTDADIDGIAYEGLRTATMLVFMHIIVQMALVALVLLRPHREPASRIAWIVVIVALPVVGIIAYLLLGETNIGRRPYFRIQRRASAHPVVDPGWGNNANRFRQHGPS